MSEEDKKILNEAKKIILANKNVSGGMEVIREAMNDVYSYFKSIVLVPTFSDTRLLEIFKLELLMDDIFLPLRSEPSFDSNNPPNIPDSIKSKVDCEKMMECIVYQTRAKLNIKNDVKNATLSGLCKNASYYVKEVCKQLGVNQRHFGCSQSLDYGCFHFFNIVNFELPEGETKMYLVDCTYRQFFTYAHSFMERIGLPLNYGASIGAYMMMDDTRKKMAEELLIKGYIEFNPQNIKNYFDGFVFSGRNGLYYEQLGKQNLEKSDFEPDYTYVDYLSALNHRGLKNESFIGRQFDVLSKQINFDFRKEEENIERKKMLDKN